MQCPKCSYEPTLSEIQDSPEDCVKCGISYASYTPKSAAERLGQGVKGAREAVREGRARRLGSLYSPACGTVSEGCVHTRGSIWIELVLWLFFLVPGIIYSIWRLTSRRTVCPACHNPGLIPVASPKASKELGGG